MAKIQHCIIWYCFFREVISKTRASCFVTISKHSKTIKRTRPKRPRASICFLVFKNRDETLALVFEILLLTSSYNFASQIGIIGNRWQVYKTSADRNVNLIRAVLQQFVPHQSLKEHSQAEMNIVSSTSQIA